MFSRSYKLGQSCHEAPLLTRSIETGQGFFPLVESKQRSKALSDTSQGIQNQCPSLGRSCTISSFEDANHLGNASGTSSR